jgi:predicted transposase YdaD
LKRKKIEEKPSEENKQWDASMLSLFRASPQAFVNLCSPGARYLDEQPQKLQSHPRTTDGLVRVLIDDEIQFIHFEFQSYNDETMAERLLEYNTLIWNEFGIPVVSCVIHLLGDGQIAPSPLQRRTRKGKKVVDFYYDTIEIGDLVPEDILAMHQPGLLPLLTLTKGGATRDVIHRMFSELETVGDQNLTSIAYTLATYSLKRSNEGEVPWFERTHKHMHDIITESPFYKSVIEKGIEQGRQQGIEKGIEQGRQQGIEQGQLTALRQATVDVVQERLPALVQFAESQIATINDPARLRQLVVKLITVPNAEQAIQAFFDAQQGK